MSEQPDINCSNMNRTSSAEKHQGNDDDSKCQPAILLREHCEAAVVRPPHIPDGHTFVVRTIVSEKTTITTTTDQQQQDQEKPSTSRSAASDDSTSKAIVPLSSSLPSKLLRLHARRSAQAQALLHQLDQQQSRSIDSQFSSDEGSQLTGLGNDYTDDCCNNACADIFDSPTPTAPAMSPVPDLPPLLSPAGSLSSDREERLIDVGMGSSIEGSEESEEDDELKPLAVDNHVRQRDIDMAQPSSSSSSSSSSAALIMEAAQSVAAAAAAAIVSGSSSMSNSTLEQTTSPQPAILSEANLEKFRKHHMDNIYLHPNFKHDFDEQDSSTESSPPPAVAPANSPVEQRRAHRSFLTMAKKPNQTETVLVALDPAAAAAPPPPPTAVHSVHQQQHTTHATASTNTDPTDLEEHSGINEIDTLDSSLIPNDELAAEIAEAVEFYFSNESILKDAFLLKHVRRNKEGFVSLKLVSSFKRVRQLTKDWRIVGYAVREKSDKIELNDLGTKVRRQEALPSFDETMPSRTIVASDLPLDKLTIEKVSDIFSKCGEIALIRILKPGMAIPVDVRQFMNKYPEMMQKECALVEFVESSAARDARNLQGPFQVYEMVAPKKKTGKKAIIQVAAPIARMVENYRYYNDPTYERTRGGSFSGVIQQQDIGDLRYKLKRNNSDFPTRGYTDLQQQQNQNHHQHHYAQHQNYHSQNNSSNNHHQSHYGGSSHRGSFGEHTHTHPFQHYQPRGSISHVDAATSSTAVSTTTAAAANMQDQSHSPSGNFFAYSPRRYSNTSTISANTAAAAAVAALGDGPATQSASASVNPSTNPSVPARRLSNCSDSYTSYSEASRRPSNCSEHAPQRRDSQCSESCPCSRRVSDFGQNDSYHHRKTSQCSIGSHNGTERRFSNGSLQFERTFSNGSDGFGRRMSSSDYNYERKPSLDAPQSNYDDGNVGGGGGGYNVFARRYSNNFNVSNKLAAYDNAQYINGRRISTDSGYDRRYSFGSEYEGSPRSRTGSFLSNYKNGMDIDGQPRSRTNSFLDGSPRSRSGSLAQRNAENLLRTPLGPDGSRGFGIRTRKFGQNVSPV